MFEGKTYHIIVRYYQSIDLWPAASNKHQLPAQQQIFRSFAPRISGIEPRATVYSLHRILIHPELIGGQQRQTPSYLLCRLNKMKRMFINHHLNDLRLIFQQKSLEMLSLTGTNWPPLFRVCGGIFCDELPFTCFVVSQILDHVCLDKDDLRKKYG